MDPQRGSSSVIACGVASSGLDISLTWWQSIFDLGDNTREADGAYENNVG